MLHKKVIVVTGGAGLIGKEFIKAIAKNNAIAVIADFDHKLAQQVKNMMLNKYNLTNIDVVQMDITKKQSIKNAIRYLDKKYKRIDAVVNSAYPRNKAFGDNFFDIKLKNFNENINLNLGGYFLVSQQFAKYFNEQNNGNIINIASIYGVVAPKFELYENTNMTLPIEYAAIKSALIHMTQYMAKYFKGMNIRVNAISPGGIFDNQDNFFLKKYEKECLNKGMLNQNDLTGTLLYLLSDMSQYVNGQNIIVDDGFVL